MKVSLIGGVKTGTASFPYFAYGWATAQLRRHAPRIRHERVHPRLRYNICDMDITMPIN